MASLQDQLLKAGLVDGKQAKQIKKEQRKKAKQVPKGQAQTNETREQAKQAQAERSARDREINRQQREAAELKAIAAQIKQLIETNSIARDNGDSSYQFTDGKKIKKIYVTEPQHNQLSKGQIAVAKLKDDYHLIPAVIAEKIQQRGEGSIVSYNLPNTDTVDEDDPYADYPIPDDLDW